MKMKMEWTDAERFYIITKLHSLCNQRNGITINFSINTVEWTFNERFINWMNVINSYLLQ